MGMGERQGGGFGEVPAQGIGRRGFLAILCGFPAVKISLARKDHRMTSWAVVERQRLEGLLAAHDAKFFGGRR